LVNSVSYAEGRGAPGIAVSTNVRARKAFASRYA
jgi:hypothetical protein